MSTRLIIQRFSAGTFDNRHRDVIRAAVEAAGLESYRLDEARMPLVRLENESRRLR
jgi:hypothetical protein